MNRNGCLSKMATHASDTKEPLARIRSGHSQREPENGKQPFEMFIEYFKVNGAFVAECGLRVKIDGVRLTP